MSLLRVSLVLAALTLGLDAAAQAIIGAPCDPNLRDPSQGNLNGCTGALRCRWVTGTCVVTERFTGVQLANLDRQCLDDPTRGEATATTPFWADCSVCTGVTGQCEELDVCNADGDCLVRDHRCIEGLCQFAPEPASLPGGGCTSDAGCHAQGAQFRCVSGVCVEPEKMAGWNLHDARVGFKSQCGTSGDCGRFQRCLAGLCLTDTTECSEQRQCGEESYCVAKRCVYLNEPPPHLRVECSKRSDCRDKEVCVRGMCADVRPTFGH